MRVAGTGYRPARRPHLVLVVVLGHALLALGLLQATRPDHPLRPVASPVTTWLRWVGAPARPPAVARPPEQRKAERPPPPQAAIPTPGEAAPITPAAPAPLAGPVERAPAALQADGPAPPKPAPLDLSWQRPSAPASAPPTAGDLLRNDARQPPPLTRDERLARALGTDTTLHEEVLDGGKRRFRAGRGCVETRPTRAAQLDPFNQSVRPTPQLAEACR